jgi:shikimate kinase
MSDTDQLLTIPPRILLIGYRGTGKSTVARRLARDLGYEALDADDEIEARAGCTIAELFATSGEAAFRDLEEEVVADLCRREHVVIALGGGAVLRAANRAAIRASGGPVVWLTAIPETIRARVTADGSTSSRRPNLTTVGGLAEIEKLLKARLPLYRECATLVVDTEGKPPEKIAAEILAQLPPPPPE